MTWLKLDLTSADGDQVLLELALKIPDEDVENFRALLEDYFVGMAVTNSKPNLIPTEAEVL